MSVTLTKDDEAFINELRSGRYPAEKFSHIQHLKLAWLHCSHLSPEHAITQVCADIKTYVNALGAQDKFNFTLTSFLSAVVYSRVCAVISEQNFDSWLDNNSDLKFHAFELVKTFYSVENLNSENAKEKFVWPDRLELPPELNELLEKIFS